MASRRARAALALLLGVAAIAAASGALEAGAAGGGTPGASEGDGWHAVGDSEGGLLPTPEDDVEPNAHPLVVALVRAVFALAAVLSVVLLPVAVYRWGPRGLLRRLASLAPLLVYVVLGVLAFAALLLLFDALFGANAGGGGFGGVGVTGVGGDASGTAVDLPLPLVVVVAGAAVVLVALLITSARDDRSRTRPTADAGPSTPEPDASTRRTGVSTPAPGDGDVPADNAVYRAWLALADEADADPRRDSPARVERRALADGADPDAVSEITALFEAVRYGDAEVTAERERRAESARDALGGGSS